MQIRLALKLLWRNWRSGELRILSSAVVLAVAVVTAIAVFSDRMDRTISRQSHAYLAADLQVVSRFPIPTVWLDQSRNFPIQQSQSVEFASMVFSDDDMTLASIKAVANQYPLRGALEISHVAFPDPQDVLLSDAIPAPGNVWVDSSLLPMLNVQMGDRISLGESQFTVTKVVVHEPDGSQGFVGMAGPRVMMNREDLAATQVVQPGSRMTYRWLVAGEQNALTDFRDWITPQLDDHYRLVTLAESQRNISGALNRGKSFLMLSGMVGVLLAGVAIAMAAQQFARVQQDSVALLKSLGQTTYEVRINYLAQMMFLALIATCVGVLVGELLQRLIVVSVESLFAAEFVAGGILAYSVGMATGLLCLLCFVLPSLWSLPTLSPVRIFRNSIEMKHIGLISQTLFGLFAVVIILGFYSADIKLTVISVLGIVVVIILAAIIAGVVLRLARSAGAKAGSVWRLAVANLTRNVKHSTTQLVVFSIAFMLLLVMFLVRTSLINEWRTQLPNNAPNYFILNIAAYETQPVTELFAEKNYTVSPLYPLILARLVGVNGEAYQEQDRSKSDALRRELNLSWTQTLPPDNQLLEGQWWDDWHGQGIGVSVEEETAQDLGLALGDQLQFSVGGLNLEATVSSIRSVDWNALTPNFYFLFSPGALDDYAPSYLTSAFVPDEDNAFIPDLIRSYPTISVIEIDRIVDRIQAIIDQVSRGIELVLWVVLFGGVLVLVATVNASMASRRQEAGILRALGSNKQTIVGSLWLEFSLLGLCAGILGVLGCEVLMVALRVFVFEQPVVLHPHVWLLFPGLCGLSVGVLGALACYRVVTVPPAVVLRQT